jgi:hypothetical protein
VAWLRLRIRAPPAAKDRPTGSRSQLEIAVEIATWL